MLLAGEPPRFHQRHQVGDMVKMVMGQKDGVGRLITCVGSSEFTKDATSAVDKKRIASGFD